MYVGGNAEGNSRFGNAPYGGVPCGDMPPGEGYPREALREGATPDGKALCEGAAKDCGEVLGVAHKACMASGEVDQRGAEAFGEGCSGALGELALGGCSSGSHHPCCRA